MQTLVSGSKRRRRINLCKTCNQCDEIRHPLNLPFSRKPSNPPLRDEKLKNCSAKDKWRRTDRARHRAEMAPDNPQR
jgi:hypothetical protein